MAAASGPPKKKARKASSDPAPAAGKAAETSRQPGSVADLLGGLAGQSSPATKRARSNSGSGKGELSDTFSRLFTAAAATSATASKPASPKLVAAAAPAAGNVADKAAAKSAPGSGAGKKGKGDKAAGKKGKGDNAVGKTGKADAAADKKAGAKEGKEQLLTGVKRKMTAKEKSDREARTLFVGNVPLEWDKKVLRKALQTAVGDKYNGSFKPIWFRAEPLKEKWTYGNLRKAGSILKEYDDRAADAKHAYVVLELEEDVKAVRLAVHGYVADSRHTLRADGIGESSKLQTFDRKRSVFVGNLPSNTGEADLRQVFERSGSVNAVRVVRDKDTKQCKGIAFVLFDKRSSVEGALKYWGTSIKGREIRVTRVEQRGPDGQREESSHHPAALRIERSGLRRRKPKKGRPDGAGPPRSSKSKKGKDGRVKSKGSSPKDSKAKSKKGKKGKK